VRWKTNRKLLFLLYFLLICVSPISSAFHARYDLPEPYLKWEREYLKDFPEVEALMDTMIIMAARHVQDPSQDVLHNRVCAALAHRMATDMKLPRAERKIAIVTDLLHNISKEDRLLVLTDAKTLKQAVNMVARLRRAGYLKQSPEFARDEGLLAHPSVGGNLSLIHHITGAITAGEILETVGGYTNRDIERVQAAILGHSTGYWYFRKSIGDAVKRPDAWRAVYPEPEGNAARIAHDADLISQFEAESVVPDGSKWRVLAAKRWGARGAVEEAHVVHYVFQRLFDEARTAPGKALAREEWQKIQPALIKLMGLAPNADPIKALGVPKAFQ
jgi:hypothetical protein